MSRKALENTNERCSFPLGIQGFESRTSLNFFSGFLFATAKVASITAVIFSHNCFLLLISGGLGTAFTAFSISVHNL